MIVETIVTGVIGIVAGSVGTFVFFPQEKKAKDIENESKQSEEWKKLYEETHSELQQKDAIIEKKDEKIDALYVEITKHRDEKAQQSIVIAELQVENTKLKLLKCDRPSCQNRQPPTGY